MQQQNAPQQQPRQSPSSSSTNVMGSLETLRSLLASHMADVPVLQRQANVMAQPQLDLSVDVSRFWTLFKPMYTHFYLVCRACNDEMYRDSQKLAYDGERTRITHTICRVCAKINLTIRELYIQNIAPKNAPK